MLIALTNWVDMLEAINVAAGVRVWIKSERPRVINTYSYTHVTSNPSKGTMMISVNLYVVTMGERDILLEVVLQ